MRCDTWWLLPLHSVSAGTHTHKLAWLPHIGMRVKTQSATHLGCTTPEDWYSSSVFLLWIDRGLCYCLDKAIFLKTAMHAAPIKSFLKKSPTALRFWGGGCSQLPALLQCPWLEVSLPCSSFQAHNIWNKGQQSLQILSSKRHWLLILQMWLFSIRNRENSLVILLRRLIPPARVFLLAII